MSKIYDLKDLEDIFKVTKRTLFTWRQTGVLPLAEIGGRFYITEAKLLEIINNNPKIWKGGRHE